MEYEDGKMTARGRAFAVQTHAIYEALLEHGPLDKVRLRREARLTSNGNAVSASAKSRVDRALVELQVGLKVVPVGVSQAGAWNYAFVYELFQRWCPHIPEQARSIKRGEARRHLVQRYIDNVVAVDRAMIAKVFHVLSWTKRELERTIESLVGEGAVREMEVEGVKPPQLFSARALDEVE